MMWGECAPAAKMIHMIVLLILLPLLQGCYSHQRLLNSLWLLISPFYPSIQARKKNTVKLSTTANSKVEKHNVLVLLDGWKVNKSFKVGKRKLLTRLLLLLRWLLRRVRVAASRQQFWRRNIYFVAHRYHPVRVLLPFLKLFFLWQKKLTKPFSWRGQPFIFYFSLPASLPATTLKLKNAVRFYRVLQERKLSSVSVYIFQSFPANVTFLFPLPRRSLLSSSSTYFLKTRVFFLRTTFQL